MRKPPPPDEARPRDGLRGLRRRGSENRLIRIVYLVRRGGSAVEEEHSLVN